MRRPRTLGRYIASRFLLGIVGTFLLCSVLIFMIDLVELLRLSGKYGDVSMLTLGCGWRCCGCRPTPRSCSRSPCSSAASARSCSLNRKSRAHRHAGGRHVGVAVPAARHRRSRCCSGSLAVTVYNPLAAAARTDAERLFAEAFGKEANLLLATPATAPGCARTGPTANR